MSVYIQINSVRPFLVAGTVNQLVCKLVPQARPTSVAEVSLACETRSHFHKGHEEPPQKEVMRIPVSLLCKAYIFATV